VNVPTLIVSLIVLLVFVAIIVKGVKNKKAGKCSCGCGGCAMADVCHKNSNKGKN